jgi:hypothetical protein
MDNACEIVFKMIDKIQNSNLNEVSVSYGDSKSLLVSFIDTDNFSVENVTSELHSITHHKVAGDFVKIVTGDILKNENINEIYLEGFIDSDNIYGYPEFFSIKVFDSIFN